MRHYYITYLVYYNTYLAFYIAYLVHTYFLVCNIITTKNYKLTFILAKFPWKFTII